MSACDGLFIQSPSLPTATRVQSEKLAVVCIPTSFQVGLCSTDLGMLAGRLTSSLLPILTGTAAHHSTWPCTQRPGEPSPGRISPISSCVHPYSSSHTLTHMHTMYTNGHTYTHYLYFHLPTQPYSLLFFFSLISTNSCSKCASVYIYVSFNTLTHSPPFCPLPFFFLPPTSLHS